ncbi:MAG: hypothetical protein AMXMBFR33_00240 [Candidatus Xenobia bacterium]
MGQEVALLEQQLHEGMARFQLQKRTEHLVDARCMADGLEAKAVSPENPLTAERNDVPERVTGQALTALSRPLRAMSAKRAKAC